MSNLIQETISVSVLVISQILTAIFRFFVPPPPKDVSNEIVFVTGAGSGLGRLLALKMAKLGSTVVCADINKEANEETRDQIKSLGAKAFAYVCDCSKKEDIYRVADLIKSDVGDVTILINNAGIVSGKKFMETPDGLIQKTFEVNTMAHCWTVKAFLPSMLANNHGHVVSLASAAGLGGTCGLCDYCASKFGAVGFQESLNMELSYLKKDGIHTTTVCPYFINTGMFEGVKTRFPSLLPILDPEVVTDKIINAILRNQTLLYLPRILYFLIILKSLLPNTAYVTLSEFFGTSSSMDEFKGRQGKKRN